MKKITPLFYLIFFLTAIIPVNAQENPEKESNKEKIETPEPVKTKEKNTKEKKKTPDVIKENNTKPKKKAEKKIEGPILKYPGLSEEFKMTYSEHDPVEHTMINFMYGLISGGMIGFGGGLAFYTSDADLTNLYISAIATGGLGGITGIIVSLIENAKETPFAIGRPLFNYTWYGVFAGSLTGTLAGLIPYATTGSVSDLLHWIGYGTIAGLATGVALYIIIPPEKRHNIIIDSNPFETRVGYKFSF